jgi:hypothetical protein
LTSAAARRTPPGQTDGDPDPSANDPNSFRRELIVLTRAEFDALIAAVADQLEDADDVAVFDQRMAALQNGQAVRQPAEVTAATLSSDSLIRALRRWKGLTQTELAERTSWPRGTSAILKPAARQGRTRRFMPSLRRSISTRPGCCRGNERFTWITP